MAESLTDARAPGKHTMRDSTNVRKPGQFSGLAVFFLVFVPFALGHFLSCLIRTVNAVLVSDLVATVPLTAGQLGLLTSAFFLSFALVQLPVGIALDRYGPRRVQLLLMSVAAIGLVMFARGHSFTELVVARAVMGVGVGGCFMSAVKAISTWMAPGRLPSVHGYLIAVGGLGSASGTLPVRMALELTDWRGLFVGLGVAAAGIGLLIYLVSPRTPVSAPSREPAWRAALDVFRHPGFRETVILILIPHTIFFGVQGLWIGNWLSDVGGFSDQTVAVLLSLSMGAVILGAIGVGTVTEWAGRRGIRPLQVAGMGIAVFVGVQCLMSLNLASGFWLLAVLFTLVGTITGLDYAIVAQSMPPSLTGRASTCLNLLIFLGAFVVQAGFGQVIGLWAPDHGHHAPAIAYRVAFGTLVLLQLPGLIWYFMRRRSAATSRTRLSPEHHPEACDDRLEVQASSR